MDVNGQLHGGTAFPVLQLNAPAPSPLGALTITPGKAWDEARTSLGVPDLPPSITAVLAAAGSGAVAYRRPVVVATKHAEQTILALTAERAAGRDHDGNWLALPGCSCDSGATGTLFLVTPSQRDCIRSWARHGEWVLPNSQIMKLHGTSVEGVNDKPYLVHDLRLVNQPQLPPNTYQTYPISELPRGSTSRRAPIAVLANPALRPIFGWHYIQVSGVRFEALGKPLQLALPVAYDEHLPTGRVAIHQTLLRALGIRPGEWCQLQPTHARLDIRDHWGIFRDRHVVVRAMPPIGDTDVGYPVTRMSDEVMDLLGLLPGDRVLVRGQLRTHTTRSGATLLNRELRALPRRSAERPLGVDLRSAIGVDSLPLVTLDLIRRKQLGIEPGQPVLMRPAFRSLAAGEITVALNGLALAVAGSLVADRPAFAATAGLSFLALLLFSFSRRFW